MTKFAKIVKLEESIRGNRFTGFEYGMTDEHYAQRTARLKRERAEMSELIMGMGEAELLEFHAYRKQALAV